MLEDRLLAAAARSFQKDLRVRVVGHDGPPTTLDRGRAEGELVGDRQLEDCGRVMGKTASQAGLPPTPCFADDGLEGVAATDPPRRLGASCACRGSRRGVTTPWGQFLHNRKPPQTNGAPRLFSNSGWPRAAMRLTRFDVRCDGLPDTLAAFLISWYQSSRTATNRARVLARVTSRSVKPARAGPSKPLASTPQPRRRRVLTH